MSVVDRRPGVGLCQECRHARRIVSGKGSGFWLCGRSAEDPRFVKYPRLPVERCPGFVRVESPEPPCGGEPHGHQR
jgi:hypothetical protein